jgi:hypothetical protein
VCNSQKIDEINLSLIENRLLGGKPNRAGDSRKLANRGADTYCNQPAQNGVLRDASALGSRCNQQTNNSCEQRNSLNQSRDNQHGGLDTSSRFWLTGDSFHSATTDTTDTHTSTNSSQASAQSGTEYRNATRGFQQKSKQHCEHDDQTDLLSETNKRLQIDNWTN